VAATKKKLLSSTRRINEQALLTDINGAVVMLDACRDIVYRLLRDGELESFTQGRSRRITVASIKKYIERQLAAAGSFAAARHPVRPSQANSATQ
jgi:excisionase family DNA binding protein